MKLKCKQIKDTECIIRSAESLVRLKDLWDKNQDVWGNTSLDDVPLLQITKGNKLVDYITLDIFKMDDKPYYAVYANSRFLIKRRYYYTKNMSRQSLRETIQHIIAKYTKEYKTQYREIA